MKLSDLSKVNPNAEIIIVRDWIEIPVSSVEVINGERPWLKLHIFDKEFSDRNQKIKDLEEQIRELEEEVSDLKKEIGRAEKDFEKQSDEIDGAFNALESWEVHQIIPNFKVGAGETIGESIMDFVEKVSEKIKDLTRPND